MPDAIPIRLQIMLEGRQQAVTDAQAIAQGISQAFGDISRNVDTSVQYAANKMVAMMEAVARSSTSTFSAAATAVLERIGSFNQAMGNSVSLARDNAARAMGLAHEIGISPIAPTPTGPPAESIVNQQAKIPQSIQEFAQRAIQASTMDEGGWAFDQTPDDLRGQGSQIKKYISDAHANYQSLTGDDISLAQFKSQLLQANQQGLLRLSEGDLKAALDQDKIASSTTPYLNTESHFIAVDKPTYQQFAPQAQEAMATETPFIPPPTVAPEVLRAVQSAMGPAETASSVGGNESVASLVSEFRGLAAVTAEVNAQFVELQRSVSGSDGNAGVGNSRGRGSSGSGGQLGGDTPSGGGNQDFNEIIEEVRRRGLEFGGDLPQWVRTTPDYREFNLPLQDPATKARSFVGARVSSGFDLSSIPKSGSAADLLEQFNQGDDFELRQAKLVTDGLVSAESRRAANARIAAQIQSMQLRPVEGSTYGPFNDLQGEKFERDYLHPDTGQAYRAVYTQDSNAQEQYLLMRPVSAARNAEDPNAGEEAAQLAWENERSLHFDSLTRQTQIDQVNRQYEIQQARARQVGENAIGRYQPPQDDGLDDRVDSLLAAMRLDPNAVSQNERLMAAAQSQYLEKSPEPKSPIDLSQSALAEYQMSQAAESQHAQRQSMYEDLFGNQSRMDESGGRGLIPDTSFDGNRRMMAELADAAEQSRRQQVLESQSQQMVGLARGSVTSAGGIFTAPYRLQNPVDPSGNPIGGTETYTRSAGIFRNAETAKLNVDTGELGRAIHQGTREWDQFVRRIVGDGGRISQTMNGVGAVVNFLNPLNGVATAVERIGNQAIRLSAIFYSFERIGNILRSALAGPLEQIVEASEKAMKFRESIAGTVGGMGNAGRIDDQVIAMSRNSPLTLDQIRETTRGITDISALAPRMALSSPEESGKTIAQLTDIVARIGVNNPGASREAIIGSLENALLGNLRGLRLTARIDPNDLTAISGLSQKELQGNQNALIASIQAVVRSRVSDQSLQQYTMLPSVQWEKFTEQFQIAMQRIGIDSGLFDTIAERFHGMMESLATYVDSPEFRSRAKVIGDDLATIFNNVIDAGARLLQFASGAPAAANTPDTVTAQVERFTDGIAKASFKLPGLGEDIGKGFSYIIETIQLFIQQLSMSGLTAAELLQRADNLSKGKSGIGPLGDSDWKDNDQLLRQQAVLNIMNRQAGHEVGRWVDKHNSVVSADLGPNDGGPPVEVVVPAHAEISNPKDKAAFDAIMEATKNNELAVRGERQLPQFINTYSTEDASRYALGQAGYKVSEPTAQNPFAGLMSGFLARDIPAQQPQTENREYVKQADYETVQYKKLGVQQDLEGGSPYFSALSGLSRTLEKFGGGSEDKFDKFSKFLDDSQTQLRGAFSTFTTGRLGPNEVPSDFFTKAKQIGESHINDLQSQADRISEDLSGRNQIEGASDSDSYRQLEKQYYDILRDIVLSSKALADTLATANEDMKKAAGNFTIAGVGGVKGEDASVAAKWADTILSGNTAVQRSLADNMRSNGAVGTNESLAGLGSVSLTDQSKLLQEQTKYHLASLKEAGTLYRAPETSSLLFNNGVDNQQLAYLQSKAPEYLATENKAIAVNATTPSDEGQLAVDRTTAAYRQLVLQMDQLNEKTDNTKQAFIAFGNSAQNSLENGLGKSLTDLETHTGKLSDVFHQLGLEIVSAFNQAMIKDMFNTTIGGGNAQGTSGFGGIFSAGLNMLTGGGLGSPGGTQSSYSGGAQGPQAGPSGPNTGSQLATGGANALGGGLMGTAIKWAMGLLSPQPAHPSSAPVGVHPQGQPIVGAGPNGQPIAPNPVSGSPMVPQVIQSPSVPLGFAGGFATGGIVPGFDPIQAFAGGGTVSKPTLGLVGERHDGVPEAIVPMLGHGGRIPLGMDAMGVHAKLPGGRTIAAAFADGGITDGFTAFAGGGIAEGGFSPVRSGDHYTPAAGSHGGTSESPETHVTIYTVANHEQAMQQGYSKMKGHILNDVFAEGRPGGKLRQVLNKKN